MCVSNLDNDQPCDPVKVNATIISPWHRVVVDLDDQPVRAVQIQ